MIVAPRRRASAACSPTSRSAGGCARRRFDLAIDFHGGPRASLLTWLSGAPVRIGYEVAGRSWMYTARVARPRELRPRHSVENQWDLLARARHRARRTRPPTRSRWRLDRAAAAAVAERLARAGVSTGERLDRHPRQRRQPVPALAGRRISSSWSPRSRPTIRAPHHRHVGPVGSDAAARVIAARARRLGAEAATRVLSCGEFSLAELRALLDRAALYIGGDSGPLHIAATTRCRSSACTGRRCRRARRRGARRPIATESVDAGGLPCRPCDQRVCVPGDFRCLTSIPPTQVVDAARRAVTRSLNRSRVGAGFART